MRRFLAVCISLMALNIADAQIIERLSFPKPLYQFPDTATIVFMGDVMMHTGQINDAYRKDGSYDFSTYLSNISKTISEADLSVANMEFTLAGKPYSGYPVFSAPDGFEEYVAGCGVDIFLTANNHIFDKGRSGLKRTLEIYGRMESEGHVKHTGCFSSASDDSTRFPLIVAVKGIRIALVNFTYGTNVKPTEGYPNVHTAERMEIAAAIRKAKDAGVDYIIALPHWGVEYVLRRSASQASLARWLAEEGCDAVIGSHPHVVQDFETISVIKDCGVGDRQVPVVYSLGNIVSNMSAANTQIGLMVTLKIATDKFGDRKMLDPVMTLTWCTRPGSLTGSYATIPVKEYLGKRDLWINGSDYDRMVTSYERIKETTGIKD